MNATGTPPLRYRWLRNGLEMPNAVNSILVFTNFQWHHAGDYNVVVYNAAGAVLRAGGGSDETQIGNEIDLLLNWQIDRHTAAYIGYSHFFAGDFLEETGPADDIDFFYAAVTFTF